MRVVSPSRSGRIFSGSARRSIATLSVGLLVATALSVVVNVPSANAATSGSPCGATINPIVCENRQTGTPQGVWDDITGVGDTSIQGFATNISVNAGTTEQFKIDTDSSAYRIDIYRLGYYGGNGARKVISVTPSATLPQIQPDCATDPTVTLVDCGTWGVSASWPVPSTAVSGVYIADLVRTDSTDPGGMSQIPFIVRNDASHSDVVYQTSDPTWEAYNRYGDADFYTGITTALYDSPSRAREISYNRPFATRGDSSGRDYLFSNEFPTIMFMEQNGYDVSYISGVDTDRYGATLLTNHKVFMSVGHDEYWSQAQRTNVENARDAGVNLMFLSGNEVFWHTRYLPSIDGSNTAYRTIVDYKETWDNAPTDPSGEATATWRDPRFSASPGGSNPENALTGVMTEAIAVDLPITVTAAQGKDRLWRNTGLSSMSGSSTALAQHTVGYESDEDVDNGFRPAGLVDLSTTVGPTSAKFTDFGNATQPSTTTQHLTLYRAPSGALVFAAGTVQWGWGLSADHDGAQSPADPRIQQATINMLADMGSQPQTIMSGLVTATASSDTQAPTSTITSPTSGSSIANGTSVTVTGTAVDNGGGVVAGVEVSLDGGATWHPASGTTSWTYTGILYGSTTTKILSRASDDSVNTETPSAGVTVSTSCPCTLFGQSTPATPDSGDAFRAELGTRFTATTSGYITGMRFYKSSANTGTHTGALWTSTGAQLATGTFSNETATGWQTLLFSSPVAVSANTTYVVGYWAPNGHYSADSYFFYYKDYQASPLTAPSLSPTDTTKQNGVYATTNGFPNQSFLGSNYYVDPIFLSGANGLPAVLTTNPASGATNIPVSVAPSAIFSTAVVPASVNFTLAGPAGLVSGAVTYNSSSNTATFTPSAALSTGTQYTATLSATGTSGTAMPAPYTWTFKTTGPVSCPCTLFSSGASPGTSDSGDSAGITVGLQFSSSTAGYITGAKFYKTATNTGTHTASLWSSTGTRLATATYTNETASGWQSVTFNHSVAIAAATTYVISDFDPAGHYSEDDHYFDASIVNPPFTAPSGAGLYAYGSTATFPSSSYANANYWVDAIFNTSPVPTVLSVTSTSPSAAATGVSAAVTPSAVFSDSVTPASINMTLTGPSGSIPGTVSYDDPSTTATFTPSATLTAATTYTVSVTATATDGTAMTSPATWSFTTASAANCPCTLFGANASPATVDSGDRGAVTVGVQFSSGVTGFVTGIRFYKAATNVGTHTATLWSSSGTALASGTFTSEGSSGWQTLSFANPVPITAGVTYVASYYAPSGHYAEDDHYFDAPLNAPPLSAPIGAGVYANGNAFPSSSFANANYWVDPIVSAAADLVGPTVTSTFPVNGATAAGSSVSPTVTFSTGVTSASVNFTMAGPSGNVAGAVSYNSASNTATFDPTLALAANTTYTATVSATGTNSIAMANPYSWTFTTVGSYSCPCSVLGTSATPTTADSNDGGAVTVGMRFSSIVDGSITGMAFYKAAANTGTHVGTLWTAGGAQLATGTFTNESASGWQTLTFSAPVAITANTTYVVSYTAPAGHYSEDDGYFTGPITNGPLTAPVSAGVYTYDTNVPSSSFAAANYWVDPIFTTAPAAPSVASVTPAPSAGGVAVSSAVAAIFDSSLMPASLSFSLTGPSGVVTGTAVYDDPSKTATFTPAAALATSTTYTATVSATGSNGVAMGHAASWHFTTAAPPAAPTVTSVTPSSGSTNQSTASKPSATFSASVISSSIAFTVTGPSGPVTGSVAYVDATRTATFTPAAALAASTTYNVSVSATGVNGAAMPSPTTWSFATAAPPDTTPPVISAVSATGSGTTATVKWTTNENSTSRVDYGTTTASLNLSTSSATLVTSHTVALSGLTPNTRYYYRVSSADASTNTATSPASPASPASYAPTTTPITDSTTATFAAGTVASTYVSSNGVGDVVLTPAVITEFPGTTLPTGWTSTATVTGGKSTVANGSATIQGANVTSTASYGSGQMIETLATLGKNQTIGWMSTGSTSVKMSFSVNAANQLVATVNDGFLNNASGVAVSAWTAAPHKFRIEWTSSAATFYVDDVQKYTHAFTSFFGSTYKPQLSDSVATDAGLAVDWLRVGTYAATGTFTSRVFDATAVVTWDGLSWTTSTLPAGTTLVVKVRTGTTLTPDASWTAFTTVPTSGASVAKTTRYLQYQLTLTASGSRFVTPTVTSVSAAYHV